jgi:DNA-binding LytR/AlgR family response regulator
MSPVAAPSAQPRESRLRALVVEAEWPERNYLVELIEATKLAEVVGAVANVDEAREVLGATDGSWVDVVFLDVQPTGTADLTGLDLVRSMANSPAAPMFVLATAFSEHAVEAFDLGVVDYILKPFSQERIERALRRLLERHHPRPLSESIRVVARRKKGLVFLDPREIWAFEAADRLTFVHSSHGKFDIDLSLVVIEASIGRAFTRVHRNWLVNLLHVKQLERESGETTLFVGVGIGDKSPGISVPVSRERAQPVREMLLANATGIRR